MLVNEARTIGYCQWELMSLSKDIVVGRRTDYLTRRNRGLKRAVHESRHRIVTLQLYSAYIRSDPALAAIDKAIGLVEGNIYLYQDLGDLIEPYVHPPNRYNQLVE